MNSGSLYATLDKIDALPQLAPSALAPLLGFDLQPVKDSTTPQVFEGSGAAWKKAELRVVEGRASRGILILTLPAPIPLAEVTRKYGSKFNISPPNPSAPESTSAAYEYRAKHGVIRFLFPSLDDPQVREIVFDRF